MKDDQLEQAKRIMERLVKTPHKLHKDEPPKRPAKPKPPKKKAVDPNAWPEDHDEYVAWAFKKYPPRASYRPS